MKKPFTKSQHKDGRIDNFPLLRIGLDVLSLLFLGRVLAQLGVFLGMFPWLPPMNEWQSGLLTYQALLSSQVLILLLMAAIRLCLARMRSNCRWIVFFPVRIFAIVYAAAMFVRFILFIQAQFADNHFFGIWIPIFFHWVLAGYLYILSLLLEGGRES